VPAALAQPTADADERVHIAVAAQSDQKDVHTPAIVRGRGAIGKVA
jgi:hypothetical protein